MRDFLIFLVFCAVVFFGVGEWRGWYVGIPPQTPIFAYKTTSDASYMRRVSSAEGFPLQLSGKVKRGTLTVEGTYEKPSSFQTGKAGGPERAVFRQVYYKGDEIDLSQMLKRGQGIYRVKLTLEDASGTFRLDLPTSDQL